MFFILLVTTVSSSVVSFERARQCLDRDLSRAMSLTIKDKGYERMKQDSIKAYRLLTASAPVATREHPYGTPSPHSPLLPVGSKVLTVDDPIFQQHIQTEALRSMAFIAYQITPHNDDFEVRMEGRANYSMAFVWGISDQHLSGWLCMGTVFFLLLSLRRRKTAAVERSTIPLHLTPMQEQLMDMFLKAPNHRLTKQEICNALWPNKDNAAETLYTTIRRLRNELQDSSDWEIESERGKSYELRRRQ